MLEQIKYHQYGGVFANQLTDARPGCAEALLQALELSRAALIANDNLTLRKRANWQLRCGAQDFGEPRGQGLRGYDLKARNGPGTIGFDRTTSHDLRSATKSVTALILGAAIDRGMIADVNQSVLSFFPEYADLRTPEKDQITIRDL